MSTMKTIGATAIIALTGGLYAQNANCKCGKGECRCTDNCSCACESCKCAGCGESSGWSYAPGEGVSFNETPILSTEVSLSFDSRYMTYGVIDGKDPIFTLGVTGTFFDWAYIGVESIFDLTDGNGKRGGYGKRGFKYTTLDAFVGLAHEFDLGEKSERSGWMSATCTSICRAIRAKWAIRSILRRSFRLVGIGLSRRYRSSAI